MQLHHWTPEELTFEPTYNVRAIRLPKLAGEPYEGGAWVVVEPGATMTEHVNPDRECEIFFFVEGGGLMRVGADSGHVGPGDTVLIPPDQPHSLTNDGPQPLRALALWWGAERAGEASR